MNTNLQLNTKLLLNIYYNLFTFIFCYFYSSLYLIAAFLFSIYLVIFVFQVVGFLSISFIVLSTVALCLNTMPDIQHRDSRNHTIDNPHLETVEAVCIGWFTLEYILRFIASPAKIVFLKGALNIIGIDPEN